MLREKEGRRGEGREGRKKEKERMTPHGPFSIFNIFLFCRCCGKQYKIKCQKVYGIITKKMLS